MRSFAVLAAVVALVAACNSDGGGEIENPYDTSEDASYPDTQIALVQSPKDLARNKWSPPMVLVNRTHGGYLVRKEGEAVPGYRHPYFSRIPSTAWIALPNEDMSVFIEEQLRAQGYFTWATPFDLSRMQEEGWPPREAILVEHAGQVHVLYNPKELDATGTHMTIAPEKMAVFEFFKGTKDAIRGAFTHYAGSTQIIHRGQSDDILDAWRKQQESPEEGER